MIRILQYLCVGFFILSSSVGCVAIDCGYASNDRIVEYSVPYGEKFPVTLSVTGVEDYTGLVFSPDAQTMQEKLVLALEATGLFSEIQCVSGIENEGYHIQIQFIVGGQGEERANIAGQFAGGTLLLIPVWEDINVDASAILYLRGVPLHSIAMSEKMKTVWWLPLAPIGIFWNSIIGWSRTEKGVINGLINDTASFHKKRFLDGE